MKCSYTLASPFPLTMFPIMGAILLTPLFMFPSMGAFDKAVMKIFESFEVKIRISLRLRSRKVTSHSSGLYFMYYDSTVADRHFRKFRGRIFINRMSWSGFDYDKVPAHT